MLNPKDFTEEQKKAVERLRKMGLSNDAAENWVIDRALADAPVVEHEVVHEPLAATVERLRMGRFAVEMLWQQHAKA